jgi:hypothetical protein
MQPLDRLTGNCLTERRGAPSLHLLGRFLPEAQPVRRTIQVCLAVVALMLLGYAHAQPTDHVQPADHTQPTDQARPTDDSLRIYAVDIWHDPP